METKLLEIIKMQTQIISLLSKLIEKSAPSIEEEEEETIVDDFDISSLIDIFS